MEESSMEDNDTVNLVVGCDDSIVDEVGGVFEEVVWHTPRHVTEEGFHVLSEEDVEESRLLLEQLDRHYAEQRSAEVRAYRNSLTSIVAKRAAARVCASSLFALWRPGAAAAAALDLHSEVVRRVCLYIPLAGEKVAQLFLQGGVTAEGLDTVVRSAAGGNIAQYVRHIAIDGMMLGVVAATVVEAAGSSMLVLSGKLDPSTACTRVGKNVACTGVGVMAGAAAASAAALLVPTSPLAAPIATTLAHFAASWGARKKLDDDAVKATENEAKKNLAARIAASAARAVWRREGEDDEVVQLPYRESVEVVDGVDGEVSTRVVEVVDGVVVPSESEVAVGVAADGQRRVEGDEGAKASGTEEGGGETEGAIVGGGRGPLPAPADECSGDGVEGVVRSGSLSDQQDQHRHGSDAKELQASSCVDEVEGADHPEEVGVGGVAPQRGGDSVTECKRPCLGVRAGAGGRGGRASCVAQSVAEALGDDDVAATRYFNAPAVVADEDEASRKDAEVVG